MNGMRDLAGRNVVVTGAGGGLGPAVVERLVDAGATVHAPVRRPPSRAGGKPTPPALHVTAGVDLADEAAVTAYYAGLPPLWASVHLVGGYAGAALADTSAALVRKQLELNYLTALLCCREAAGRIRHAGGGGRLLNVASRAALVPGPGAAAYAASKAAVVSLTRVLATELEPHAIWVNAVAPATIDTPSNRTAMPSADTGAWTAPSAIAEAIAWLVSPANATVTGAIIPV